MTNTKGLKMGDRVFMTAEAVRLFADEPSVGIITGLATHGDVFVQQLGPDEKKPSRWSSHWWDKAGDKEAAHAKRP